jgi:arylsulfatase A-like enzyme
VLQRPEVPGRDALVFAYKDFQRALRADRWKLILYSVDGRETVQLFDLEEDPWETVNLAGEPEHRERVTALRRQLQVHLGEAGDPTAQDMPG